MRKLIIAVAGATMVLAGSAALEAEAAPLTGVAALPPLTKSTTPLEQVACWCGPYRCACRGRYWRRGWGPRVYWGPRPWRWRY